MMRKYLLYLLVFAGIILNSCANVGMPTGGERDIAPPELLRATPPNNTVNFSETRITLVFDEFFVLQDQRNIFISPPLEQNPTFRVRGRNLEINIPPGQLEPNTTYSISFPDNIRDLNEGNILRNFLYVFSTGDYIDTLFLRGTVIDAFTHEPVQNAVVLLYSEENDSALLSGLPMFAAKADESGNFLVSNLPDRRLQVFAIEDKNNNLRYDAGERTGFISEPVSPADTLLELNVLVFRNLPDSARLLSHNVLHGGKFQLNFNKPINNIDINIGDTDVHEKRSWNLLQSNNNKDTFLFWSTSHLGTTGDFTLDISADELTRSITLNTSRLPELPTLLGIRTNINNNILHPPFLINLLFSDPVLNIEVDSIFILKDDTIAVPFQFEYADSLLLSANLHAELVAGESYNLYFPRGTFMGIFGNKSDSVNIPFNTSAIEDFGSIEMTIENNSAHLLLVNLLRDGYEPVRTIETQGGKIIFPNLVPGRYRIQVIIDKNNNARWDSGNIFTKTEPEPVYFYPEIINVRANWDVSDLVFIIEE